MDINHTHMHTHTVGWGHRLKRMAWSDLHPMFPCGLPALLQPVEILWEELLAALFFSSSMQAMGRSVKQMAWHSWHLLIWVGGRLINTIEGDQSCCLSLSGLHTVCVCLCVWFPRWSWCLNLIGDLLKSLSATCWPITEFGQLLDWLLKSVSVHFWLFVLVSFVYVCVGMCLCSHFCVSKSCTQVHCLKVG